ncbi:MAG: hypothetical protein F7B59_04740 [Desulfurococcales archaeon]|nr:hypothetical protein [Desulfurococcales archaeon]
MKRINRIISVLLLFMLVIQPLIMLNSAIAESDTSHITVKADISDNQTILHIDSKLYGENAKKYVLHNNLEGIGKEYTLNVFFNSTEFHLDGTIQVSKNTTAIPQGPQPPGNTGQTMGIGTIGNFTANIKAHIEYTPETNITHVTYQGHAEFDVQSNQTGGHYIINFNGERVRNLTMEVDNANLVISHKFEMTGTGSMSGMGGSFTGTSVTAHTYVDIVRNTITVDDKSNTHTHIKIITDDSADWMLIQGLALMMHYQGANVTMPPMGELPIVGQRNVTVTIDMSKSVHVNMQLFNATRLNILNKTKLGPFTGDAIINITEDSAGYTISIEADGTGDFSNGVILAPYGVTATYVNMHIEGSRIQGSEKQVATGDIKLKQEDPGIVFLGIKHAMMKSYAKTGHNAAVDYTFQSGSSDIKFLLDNSEYTHVTFTSNNVTKLPELKLEYNGTIISGANGMFEFIILKHLPKTAVTIPSAKNMSKVVIRAAESDSLIIHPRGGIHAAKEVTVNITIAGNHQILMQLTPGTDISGDINISVLKNPQSLQAIPGGYIAAGPGYEVNTNAHGKIVLGIKTDKDNLNNAVVVWIHGTGTNTTKEILHPFKIDEHSRMVYITVPGFSTFIPVIPATETTVTQTTGTTTGTSTQTTSTTSGIQTSSTGTMSTHSYTTTSGTHATQTTSSTASSGTSTETSGAKSSTGVIAGVIIVIIILAFAGYYLARR